MHVQDPFTASHEKLKISNVKLLILLLLLVGLTGQTSGQDALALDSLKVVHGSLMKAVDAGNLDAIVRGVHPEAIAFLRDSTYVTRFGPEHTVKDALSELLVAFSGMVSVTHDEEFRVYGNTGIVVERSVMQPGGKSKKETRPTRTTLIYSRQEDGRWLLVSWHGSATPLR